MARTKKKFAKKKAKDPLLKNLQVRDVAEATRTKFKTLHDKIEEQLQNDFTQAEILDKIFDLALQPAGKTKLQPGQVIINSASITDWDGLQNFEGAAIEDKINNFLAHTKSLVEQGTQITKEFFKSLPVVYNNWKDDKNTEENILLFCTEAMQAITKKNGEIQSLREQIQEQDQSLEDVSARLDELKQNAIELTGTQFVCEVPQEVGTAILQKKEKLLETGAITKDDDTWPAQVAVYALQQLVKT